MFAVDRRTKMLTLGPMCFALFMAMLDNTVVNVALPSIQDHFGSGVSGLQWIIDGYTLVFASLHAHRRHARRPLRTQAHLPRRPDRSSPPARCSAASPRRSPSLIAGRAVQGLGAAALLPGTLSILTHTFPDPSERAQAIGIWAGVSGMALAAGPVVGGALVDSLGWQSVFFLNVPIGIVALHRGAARGPANPRTPRGGTSTCPARSSPSSASGSLTYALIEANNYGWTSPLILSLFAVAVVALAAFLWVELRSTQPHAAAQLLPQPRPSPPASTVRRPGQLRHVRHVLLPDPVLAERAGLLGLRQGLRALPMTGAIIVMAPLAGRLAGRIGSRIPMTVGLTIIGVGMLLMERITPGMPLQPRCGGTCRCSASAWAW